VLALLALALFPVLAHAESAEKVYEVEVPSIESESPTHKQGSSHNSSNPKKAEGSAAAGTGTENSGEPEGEAGEEGQKKSSGGTSGGGNNNPPTSSGGGGSGGNKPSSGGVGGKPEGGISNNQEVAKSQSGKPVSESTGGSSSPVVPILIAVFVLAAISIGVVLYRQRKSGQGPDRRVSSPNAG
jgi:cobalamin biosynthesis Mg chelatase CobN